MALFTDSYISSIAELLAYDSSILEVARIENVDLSAKLLLSERDLSLELQAFLLRHAQSGSGHRDGGGYSLKHVVVTSGLQQWHTLTTLALVYGDVYNSQLNDRYLGKWNQFTRMAKQTSELLFQTGLGVVDNPLPRAHPPELSSGPNGPPAATHIVTVAWRNHLGQNGAPSLPKVYTTTDGESLTVAAIQPPSEAVAFDVFVGASELELARQNPAPVVIGDTWTLSAQPFTSYDPPNSGQPPDRYLRLTRVLQRG
jgi:hypothetical protein